MDSSALRDRRAGEGKEDEDGDQGRRKTKQARSRVLAKASEALAEKRYESFALPAEVKQLFQKPTDERSWKNAETLRGIVRRHAELAETLLLESGEDVRRLADALAAGGAPPGTWWAAPGRCSWPAYPSGRARACPCPRQPGTSSRPRKREQWFGRADGNTGARRPTPRWKSRSDASFRDRRAWWRCADVLASGWTPRRWRSATLQN